jgi:hypothetical protein
MPQQYRKISLKAEADNNKFLHRAITTDPFFNILILLNIKIHGGGNVHIKGKTEEQN